MHGRTTRQDPEYPGILGIADTASVWGLCMGARTTQEISRSIPDTVSVRGYMSVLELTSGNWTISGQLLRLYGQRSS